MKRLFASTALATLLLITPAVAQETTFSMVNVAVDNMAITNAAAAKRYATISDDLKVAILTELGPRMTPDGQVMNVELSAVELSNSFSETVGSADTRLVGTVQVATVNGATDKTPYTLTVDVNQAKGYFPTDTDPAKLSASDDVYYDVYYKAMLRAFAVGALVAIDQKP